jgi:hypothetical protein
MKPEQLEDLLRYMRRIRRENSNRNRRAGDRYLQCGL